jgi:hypothetical protein
MILEQRIDLLARLGEWMQGNDPSWLEAKKKATAENAWFIPEFIELAVKNIVENFLQKKTLENWSRQYQIPNEQPNPKDVGIVMAGNLPLVGFHDLLTVFIAGHKASIKPSSKDEALIKHLVDVMKSWEPGINNLVSFEYLLKNRDAYIATGSNNTSRYFEFYFSKYPHIIRKNKTSVAVLTGKETNDDLEKLADDVYLFFGLGCRNVTKIYVPRNYDFVPILAAFKKYNWLADHHKYKNNYDYNLAIQLLNKKFYMTNGSILLVEEPALFSPISQLNYEYYDDESAVLSSLEMNKDVQCLVSNRNIPFGQAQCPSITDYADRVDTLSFLLSI